MRRSKGRDRAARATLGFVKKKAGKRKPKPMNLPNPLLVDEKEFGEVIGKMVNTEPVTLKEVVRRRNPETDPRYLPVFDFSRTVRIEKPKKKSVIE